MEDIQKQIDEIAKKMEEYARYAVPAYRGLDKEVKEKQYYEYREQYTDLKNKLNRKQNNELELTKKNKKTISDKVFVNSYGEATKREITCASYKKAQKKLEKQLLNFL